MSADAWEGMQRHGQDIAERLNSLAQDLNCLLLSHFHSIEELGHAALPVWPWSWSNRDFARVHFVKRQASSPFLPIKSSLMDSPMFSLFDIGKALGDLGAAFDNFARNTFHCLALCSSFASSLVSCSLQPGAGTSKKKRARLEQRKEDEQQEDQYIFDLQSKFPESFRIPKGSITVSTSYDSGLRNFESSVFARGDLWRAEVSHGGLSSQNASTPLFMLQLGPILFVRDSTLLLPVHLSKRHLLWYGFDRKKGLHSLCPAIWSKHKRWLCMSMICLNPLSCSFMDVQFPNGQLTYISGEGVTGNVIVPAFGGFLQAQGHSPGQIKLSFSCKTRWGMQLTPIVQWPGKSFSMGIRQPLSFQKSGAIIHPTVHLSVTPTLGGQNAGWRAEVCRAVTEQLNLTCGFSFTSDPSAFASVSLGRSKCPGASSLDFQVETPLDNMARASFSIKLNSSIEF